MGQSFAAPPDPMSATGAREFVELLGSLRRWAGQPSLRTLCRLAGTRPTNDGDVVNALPASTTSDLLNGSSLPQLPRLPFVEAFVAACARACEQNPQQITRQVQQWRRAWRKLSATDSEPAAAPAATAGAHQLPADVATFTGRGGEIDRLHELLTAEDRSPGVVTVCAIDGPSGVGKSALAVHLAHRVAGHFPDGQLYVDLRDGTPRTQEVLGRWLRALGDTCPVADTQEAAARLRSLVADRRMLFVLDNVADVAQVRPLLPGGNGCAVLITSRGVLATLEGAVHLHLDVLSDEESVELLGAVAGRERVAAEPDAALAIAARCGNLPLAIRIAGARLLARPDWSLERLAARLAESRNRLDGLQFGDLAVRPGISTSYRELGPEDAPAARMFRLLGVLDGAEIGVPTAAALAGVAPWDAITALDHLVDVRLLRPVAKDRYRMNELTTLYAREWLTAAPARAEYHAALGNVLDWYLAGAERASVTLRPTDSRRIGGHRAPRPAVDIPIGNPAQAVEWIDAERANLLAVIGQAAEIEGPLARTAAHLALTLYHPLANRGLGEDRVRLNQIAVRVARQAGDRWSEAQATEDLGFIYGTVGRVDEAVEHARRALRLWREVDDPASEMNALSDLGLAYRQQGQYRRAIACLQRGLVIGREIGFNRGEAVAFNHLGLTYQKTGDHQRAIDYQQRSIHRYGELDDQRGEAIALANLGWLHQRDGRLRQAADCHEGSLAIFRYFQDRYNEAEQLWGLGEVWRAQGEPSKAREYWDESLSILDVIDSLEPDEAGRLRQPVPGAPKAILLNT